ncbi:MAG: flagellar export protein FliJ [Planctomycetota bacterium]
MAKFAFRFQTLLEHRRRIEDERQRDLAKLMRTRMLFMDRLRGMQDTIRTSKHDMGSGLVGKVDVSRIAQFARYSQQCAMQGQDIVVRLAGVEKQIDGARQRLMDAVRQRKALELLRERHHEQWKYEQARREALELDDLAAQRFIRQRDEMAQEARR